MRRLGGVATWRELRAVHGRHAIEGARRAGSVERVRRGTYVLPGTAGHLRAARRLAATLSHLSAAVHHGWKVAAPPEVAWLTVRRKRHLDLDGRTDISVHWSDLRPHEAADGVTAPVRTVVDCARALPFPQALAVADSALRSGRVTPLELARASEEAMGPGARAVRRVASHADARAANPFESVLRALAIEEGFDLVPQLVVSDSGLFAVVDLGSEELRLVVEADGFEHHGTRRGLVKDCRRHTELCVFGWSSLRFTYEDVMFEPDWTRWALRSWRTVRAGGVPEPPPRRTGRQDIAA